jgi:hypothetical protein
MMKTFVLPLGLFSVLAFANTARDQSDQSRSAQASRVEFHEKMADCLKSGKTTEECRREAAPDYSWDHDDMHDSCWHSHAHNSNGSCC